MVRSGPDNLPSPAARDRAAAPDADREPVLRLRAANDNDVSLGRLARLLFRAAARPVMLMAILAALAALAFLA